MPMRSRSRGRCMRGTPPESASWQAATRAAAAQQQWTSLERLRLLREMHWVAPQTAWQGMQMGRMVEALSRAAMGRMVQRRRLAWPLMQRGTCCWSRWTPCAGGNTKQPQRKKRPWQYRRRTALVDMYLLQALRVSNLLQQARVGRLLWCLALCLWLQVVKRIGHNIRLVMGQLYPDASRVFQPYDLRRALTYDWVGSCLEHAAWTSIYKQHVSMTVLQL